MRFPLDDLPPASAKTWGVGAMYLVDLGRHVVPLRDLNALIDYRAARAEDEIRAMADRARVLTDRQFRNIERMQLLEQGVVMWDLVMPDLGTIP